MHFIYQMLIAIGVVVLIGAAFLVAMYLHLRDRRNADDDATRDGADEQMPDRSGTATSERPAPDRGGQDGR